MATRSEENKRKQQQLVNAGYKGVVVDGSWGPYQQKLWLHYLANSLGPTKQQRIDRAKQNNQREAQIARNYFSQTPSIGNLAKGVYHWWNSIPALGGQNESGVQEYNVASNPIVAAASPGGGIAKTGQLAKTAKEGYTRGKRLFGFLGRKNTISGNPRQTAFGRTLVDNAEDAEILTDAPLTSKEAIEVSRNVAKKIWDEMWVNNRFPKIINPKKAEEAKKIVSETPKQPADSKISVAKATNDGQSVRVKPTPKPSAEPPKQTPPTENVKPSSKPEEPEIPKKRGNLFWEGSDKPSANKYPNLGRHIRNWGIRVPIYTGIAAPIVDVAGNVIGAAQESDNQQHQWKFPVSSIRFTPERGAFKLISDSYSTQPKDSVTKKQSVEDDWLKQLDEAGKNVGY